MNVTNGIGSNRKYNFKVLATTFMLLKAVSLKSARSPSEKENLQFRFGNSYGVTTGIEGHFQRLDFVLESG